MLLLIALGLTFTFGQMGVINMAHGEFIMAGAYATYMLQGVAGTNAVPVALPVAFVVAGLMGLLLERVADPALLRPAARHAAADLGREPHPAAGGPRHLRRAERPGDLAGLAERQRRAGRHSVAVQPHLHPRPGRRLRGRGLALPDPLGPWTADAGGHAEPPARLGERGEHRTGWTMLTFFIGSGLAGVAGVALTLLGPVGPAIGTYYIVDAFLVVVAGGLGQIRGAVIAAFSLGLLNSFVEGWTNASLGEGDGLRRDRRFPPVPAAGPGRAADPGADMSATRAFERPSLGVARRLPGGRRRGWPPLPLTMSSFRLELLAKFLCFAIVAVGIGLAWGYGGMLTLGQGVFFGLGGYAMAMHLKLVDGRAGRGCPTSWRWSGVDRAAGALETLRQPVVRHRGGPGRADRWWPSCWDCWSSASGCAGRTSPSSPRRWPPRSSSSSSASSGSPAAPTA